MASDAGPALTLVATKLGQGGKYDRLRCVRNDGSVTETAMPRQGILPHDLLHALVESRLQMRNGFIGLVAKGADIDFAGKQFHLFIDPLNHVEVAQAESVVEGLQAQLWSAAFDAEAFERGVAAACAMRGVPAPDLSRCVPGIDLFDAAVALADAWRAVPDKSEWALSFPLSTLLQDRVAG